MLWQMRHKEAKPAGFPAPGATVHLCCSETCAGQKERWGTWKIIPSPARHDPTFAKWYPEALQLFFQQRCLRWHL